MTEPSQLPGKVIVVDDHLLFAHVVVIALTNHGFDATSVELTHEDEHGQLLLKILDDPPAVLLLDLNLGPYGDGCLLVERAVSAGLEVVVMTADDEHEGAVRAIAAGARCTIAKTSPLVELVDTLRRLLPDDKFLPASR